MTARPLVPALELGETLPTLETPRLRIRWLAAADVPALLALFGDPEVTRFTSMMPLADTAAAERLLDEIHRGFRERTRFQWGIARRADDRVVGSVMLLAVEPAHLRASVGYAVGREHWGQGFVGEALRAVVAFAFGGLGLHRLEADVDPRNAASHRALERCGFVREGHLRQRFWHDGEWQDAVVYGLLRAEARPDLAAAEPRPADSR